VRIEFLGVAPETKPSPGTAQMWGKAKVGVQRVARASRGDVEKIIRKLRLVVLTTEGIEYGFLTWNGWIDGGLWSAIHTAGRDDREPLRITVEAAKREVMMSAPLRSTRGNSRRFTWSGMPAKTGLAQCSHSDHLSRFVTVLPHVSPQM
jgi:hypothetical protein